MSRIGTIVAAGVVTLAVGGLVYPLVSRRGAAVSAQNSPQAVPLPVVEVVHARTREMSRSVALSGTLMSGSEANLSPKQGGRILSVLVKEGDRVRRDQPLVRLDSSDTQQQIAQANAGLRLARASWEKAVNGERLKRVDINRRIEEARQGVSQAKLMVEKAEAGIRLQANADAATIDRAQAGLDAAKSALAKAKKGATPLQRRQAQLGLEQADRGVQLARKNLDDLEFLHSKGGLPRIKLDEAREQYNKALDGQAQARAALDEVNAGAPPEDIAAAEAQVRNAAAALEAAKAGANRKEVNDADLAAARGQVQLAEDGLKAALASRDELKVLQNDVQAARAGYDQALAAQRLASQQLDSFVVRSPVDGIASSVRANEGEMAGPGQPMVTVVGTAGVYLEASVSNRDVAALRAGQKAEVTLDSLPGRTFSATLREVGRTASMRGVPVKLDIAAPAGVLRPGAQARAVIQTEGYPDALAVPASALRPDADPPAVWVVRNGVVKQQNVEVRIHQGGWVMVRGGVASGDTVVLRSEPGVRPEDRVETRPADGGAWD